MVGITFRREVWACTNAVRVSHVSLMSTMSIHSSSDQNLLLKTVILTIVENTQVMGIACSLIILVRGIHRNSVDQVPLSPFTHMSDSLVLLGNSQGCQ